MTIFRLTPAMASHRGLRRRTNEDAAGAEYPDTPQQLTQYGALFMVADGVGGLADGDQASQLAISQMTRHYYGSATDASPSERLQWAAQASNRTILQKLNQQAATTLAAVVIRDSQLTAISIGDSLIFHIHNGRIEQINEVDVLRDGSSDDGALTKVLGYREILEVNPFERRIAPGDAILLCTDGLTRYLEPEHLARLASLTDPRDGVRRMIMEANRLGGADNIAAVLVQIGQTIAPDDVQRHVRRLMIAVNIQDAEPMMRPDVDTKPNTQLPYGMPEIAVDSPPMTPSPLSRDTNTRPLPLKEPTRSPLILIAVAVLVLGAAILGGGLALFGRGDGEPTTLPPSPEATQAEAMNGAVSDTLAVGDVLLLSDSVLTMAQVNSEVGAFIALEAIPYQIEEQFTDNEGQLWIRLRQEDSEESGWVTVDDLPPYQKQGDG
jgi:protein phosphatase